MTLTTKFVRSHFIRPTVSARKALAWEMKLIYEFWGFCVNGDNDLTGAIGSAKGFATTGISMPSGFQSGSLLASGSDGVTHLGMPFFSSSSGVFSSTHIGSHLVTWKSGSTSTDDSIYEITQFLDSNTIRVDPHSGGTPYISASNEPFFEERSSINFRVVNLETTNGLTYTSGAYMVMNMLAAPDVNQGQALSQVKIGYVVGSQIALRLWLSPSGSWTGSAFTDGGEFKASTGTNAEWSENGSSSPGIITLIGARDFLIMHGMGITTTGLGGWHNGPAGFHIEIPERLYPQEVDPNVITANIWGQGMASIDTGKGYSACYMPIRTSQQPKLHETLVKSPTSTVWDTRVFTSTMLSVNNDSTNAIYNQFTDNYFVSDALLAYVADTTNFCMARVRLRRVRFVPQILPRFHMIGSGSNAWVHIQDSIMWPWDGARIPYRLVNDVND